MPDGPRQPSPVLRGRFSGQSFAQPYVRAFGGGFGQGIERKKSAFGNFPIGLPRAVLNEAPDDIDGNMIPSGNAPVEINAQQFRRAKQCDVAFLTQFFCKRVAQGFTGLDAAAGQMPARNIGMAHKKNPVVIIQHDGAHTERHGARQPEIEMENPRENAAFGLFGR